MAAVPTRRATSLAKSVRAGDTRALGRALTLVENGTEDGKALLAELRADTGKALIVGFTGPPGAGKSTLVDALIHAYRTEGSAVAVLAVDPVSPVSGGAVLGDRTRMGAHSLDDGVFIRSVSARGHLGGLSAAAHDMADIMDAAGWPLIMIETVGAGQSETEIAQVADLSVVVCAPGLGDELQAIKAGILEIADVLVVNKSDRSDAEQTAKQLEGMLTLRAPDAADVPVLQVSASERLGIGDVVGAIKSVQDDRAGTRLEKRRAHAASIAAQSLAARLFDGLPDAAGEDLKHPDMERLVDDFLGMVRSRTGR